MNHDVLNKTKLFEKIEIEWFSCKDVQKRRKEFRPFYAEITDNIIREKKQIKQFLYSCSSSVSLHKKTNRKNRINRKTMKNIFL
jgi:predicted transcriptional regulator